MLKHPQSSASNLLIYLTHGAKTQIKCLAKTVNINLSKETTITLLVTLNKKTENSKHMFMYHVESIPFDPEKTNILSQEEYSLTELIEYINNLSKHHHLPIHRIMLCCDGNLGYPASPYVSDELCRLLSDGKHAPLGITVDYLMLFSGTEACVNDSKNYLKGEPSSLGYMRPSNLRIGSALDKVPSTLMRGMINMLKEPEAFSLPRPHALGKYDASRPTSPYPPYFFHGSTPSSSDSTCPQNVNLYLV